ncbi:hypothetical protein ACIRQY_23025 [Streptomyces sp. NPDC101490]|uniref:hypothetical protein n=1 Tax=Streptomyces sp. NPDC101490 TaxID=3366143 RepID=UPI0038031CE0
MNLPDTDPVDSVGVASAAPSIHHVQAMTSPLLVAFRRRRQIERRQLEQAFRTNGRMNAGPDRRTWRPAAEPPGA